MVGVRRRRRRCRGEGVRRRGGSVDRGNEFGGGGRGEGGKEIVEGGVKRGGEE